MASLPPFFKQLLTSRCPGSGAAFSWIVEAVLVDPTAGDGSLYTPVGVFEDEKKAKEYAAKLAEEDTHECLIFRACPMYHFRSFLGGGKTVILSEDTETNAKILRAEEARTQAEAQEKTRKAALDHQMSEEGKVGTPAHISRLVYLCVQARQQAVSSSKTATTAETSYAKYTSELKVALGAHPETVETWLPYIKPLLEKHDNASIAVQMEAWWHKHKTEMVAAKAELPPLP